MFTTTGAGGISNVVILTLGQLRVVCIEGYFGPDCGCSPRNDSTGHFTCAADGTIVCLPGYQNPETNCTEEEVVTQESTTINMETTKSTMTTPKMDIVPIVAGGVAGGVVLLPLILTVNIVLVVIFVRSKNTKYDRDTDTVSCTNKKITTAANPMYEVSWNKNGHYDESDICTEVGETGLFAKKQDTTTLKEPQCSTTYTNVSKDSAFTAPTINEATYSTVGNGNANPEYSRLGASLVPQNAAVPESEPEYSELGTVLQPQVAPPTTTYTNVSSDVFAEPEYSEVGTAKQPQEAKSIKGDDKDTEEPGYSEIEGEQSGYSEIAEASQSPQAVYSDVNISPTSQDGTVSTKDGKTCDNINILDVQYAHIQNEQS